MNREELAGTLPQADRAGVFSLPEHDIPLLVEVATARQLAVFCVSLAGCTESGEVLARLGSASDCSSRTGSARTGTRSRTV
jgi:hypothetical protein